MYVCGTLLAGSLRDILVKNVGSRPKFSQVESGGEIGFRHRIALPSAAILHK